jgi:hypothetical protein
MKAKSHARLASFLIATGVMMLAFLSAGNASPLAAQAPTPTRAPISPALQAQCIGAARAAVNPRTGNVRFIGADSARPVPRASASASPEIAARVSRDVRFNPGFARPGAGIDCGA